MNQDRLDWQQTWQWEPQLQPWLLWNRQAAPSPVWQVFPQPPASAPPAPFLHAHVALLIPPSSYPPARALQQAFKASNIAASLNARRLCSTEAT